MAEAKDEFPEYEKAKLDRLDWIVAKMDLMLKRLDAIEQLARAQEAREQSKQDAIRSLGSKLPGMGR